MKTENKIVVVTGGASGIGEALCRRFAAEKAEKIIVTDLSLDGAKRVADEIDGLAVKVDVSREDEIRELVRQVINLYGKIDLFCSNAGITVGGDENTTDKEWQHIWEVNVKAHIFAARAVIPGMRQRGGGYLLNTASAAGLLTQVGSAPYSVTKHAAIAFAEWVSVNYRDDGIKVSCLCPQGVMTSMLAGQDEFSNFLLETAISSDECATAVIKGLEEENFLILPHPEVKQYLRRKTDDYDRWLRGMSRLRKKYTI